MDDHYFICNFLKCRQPIKDTAWVTSCSHIFCDEDGKREFAKANICPACKENLPEKFDYFPQQLNPSEHFKSVVLSGYTPDVVMDICSRAIQFWHYQTKQQLLYVIEKNDFLKDKCNRMESNYEQSVVKTKAHIELLRSEIKGAQREKEEREVQLNALKLKFSECRHQLQQAIQLNDHLRRKYVGEQSVEKQIQHRHELSLNFDEIQFETSERSTAPNNNRKQSVARPIGEGQSLTSSAEMSARPSTELHSEIPFDFRFMPPSKADNFHFLFNK